MSKSVLTIQRPATIDTIPMSVTGLPDGEMESKSPGKRTVKDEISWLDNSQYRPDPIRRKLTPVGSRIRISLIYVETTTFAVSGAATGIFLSSLFVSSLKPIEDRIDVTRVVSPASG